MTEAERMQAAISLELRTLGLCHATAHADQCASKISVAIRALPLPATPAPDEGVTQADREAYLSMNMLPEFDAIDVREGRWDNVTGVQAFRAHRVNSIAAANARIAELEGAIEQARGNISGGLCYVTAEAKHRQLMDADKTLETALRAKGGGSELPEGLWRNADGALMYECESCWKMAEWPVEAEDFELGNPANVCGGSPRCCP